MINTQLDGSGKIICVPTICLATIKTFIKMNKNISSPINKCMFKTWSPLCSRTFWRWMGGGGGFCYTDSRQLRHRHHLLLLKKSGPLPVISSPTVKSSPQSTGPLPFYQIFSTNKFPLNIFHQQFSTVLQKFLEKCPKVQDQRHSSRSKTQFTSSSFLYNIC